jgi:RNA polymerase sigma-70 factor (ECF subfamily)
MTKLFGITSLTAAPSALTDFEAVYQEYLPRLYNFFLYRFGDRALAEDLTALTFEKAWKNRARFRPELAAVSTWLFTIARRAAIDVHRRGPGGDVSLEAAQLVDEQTPEVVVERRHDLATLRALLARLPAREREVIAMKYGAGLAHQEIARLTGLTEANVGVIVHRTVRLLRKEWEDGDV